MSGKGSRQRPRQVSDETWRENWERTFAERDAFNRVIVRVGGESVTYSAGSGWIDAHRGQDASA